MDSTEYQDILAKKVTKSLKKLKLGRHWTLQQVNDPKHTSKSIKAWLEKKGRKVLEWPSQSPDLDPVENLWSLVLRQGTVDDVISRYQHELEQARAINVSLNEQLRTAQAFTLTQWLFSTYKTTRTPKTLQGCKSLNGYLAIIKGHDPPVQPAKTSQQEVQVQESQTLMLQLATTSTETENAVQPLRTDRSERSGVPAESNSEDTPSLTSKEKPPEYSRVEDQSRSVVTAIMSSIANHYSQRTNGLQTIIGLMMVVRTSNDQLAVDDEVESTLDSLPFLGRFLPLVEDHRKMVVVVGHPYGGDKMVDFCHMAALERHHIIHVMFGNPHFPQEDARKPLYHTGVMFHGSSGSPGFDTQGNVVLMHTRGFFPESSGQSLIERGVRLTAIRDHASQTLEPEVFREIFP
ncbi:hypothetical protein Bbelb_048450 [Branchiostoma belcheri]|nr:hypothetical protein Bbelb_048450 [Branchiostoma belcheri]